jgi:beta-lactamase superfamily II metal-dependent hydrolase
VERVKKKEKRKARNEEKKKKEKSRGRRKGVWNLDGSKISDLLPPHAMESDKNFRSVVYAAGSENLRPFQSRMCSYFGLAAVVCFHV